MVAEEHYLLILSQDFEAYKHLIEEVNLPGLSNLPIMWRQRFRLARIGAAFRGTLADVPDGESAAKSPMDSKLPSRVVWRANIDIF